MNWVLHVYVAATRGLPPTMSFPPFNPHIILESGVAFVILCVLTAAGAKLRFRKSTKQDQQLGHIIGTCMLFLSCVGWLGVGSKLIAVMLYPFQTSSVVKIEVQRLYDTLAREPVGPILCLADRVLVQRGVSFLSSVKPSRLGERDSYRGGYRLTLFLESGSTRMLDVHMRSGKQPAVYHVVPLSDCLGNIAGAYESRAFHDWFNSEVVPKLDASADE